MLLEGDEWRAMVTHATVDKKDIVENKEKAEKAEGMNMIIPTYAS